jgi:ArsR family transcriptional regulator
MSTKCGDSAGTCGAGLSAGTVSTAIELPKGSRMSSSAERVSRTDLIFKALASSTRREIVTILATASGEGDDRCCGDEVCACTFSQRLGLGAPTVSHHMKTLLDAGLVVAEKRGLWVYYRLAPSGLADVATAVAGLSGEPRPGTEDSECTCA